MRNIEPVVVKEPVVMRGKLSDEILKELERAHGKDLARAADDLVRRCCCP